MQIYILKTIMRENKNEILSPKLSHTEAPQIKAINGFKIDKNYNIFNRSLKRNISMNTFLLLESDQNNIFELKDKSKIVPIVIED